MIVLIDNFDSFTWNIHDYLLRCGLDTICLRNNETTAGQLQSMPLDGIVLSPGPGRPSDHPLLSEVIDHFKQKLPVLGICLGHQALGEYFGCHLDKAPLPVHGKTSMVRHTGHPVFNGILPEFEAGRYHSLVLSGIENTPLKMEAFTEKEEHLMAFSHTELPLFGIQFHPESVLTPCGLKILENWADYYIRRSIL